MHAKQKESFHRFFLEVLADALPFGEFHFHDDGVFWYEMKKNSGFIFLFRNNVLPLYRNTGMCCP